MAQGGPLLSARLPDPGTARARLLAAVAGMLGAAGMAPLHQALVAMFGISAVLWLILREGGPRQAFITAWWAGAGHFILWFNWIVSPFFVDPWVYGWMAPFALGRMSGGMALVWAAAAALSWRFARRRLAFLALLALGEMGRGYLFTGFPWALIGHQWIGSAVEHYAALIGQYGLTLMTLVLAALPVVAGRRGAAVMALCVAGLSIGGATLGARPVPGEPRAVSLRLVQPNAEQDLKWDPAVARDLFRRHLDMTRQGAPADLTIWPETAIPYLFEFETEVPGIIAKASGGKPVALGIQRVEGERGWNSLRIVEGQGEVTQTYDKYHLVPFGEYMPFGDALHDLFGLSAFAAQVGNGYSAGTAPQVLDLGPDLGRVLPLICYEAVFPQGIRAAPSRADWMLQITNDAWFGTLSGPFQHFDLARLRSIEFGLPLVRVANTGVTAVIDARGHVVARLPFGVTDKLDVAAIPPALPPTPYAKWGDWPAFVLIMLLLAGAAMRRRRFA